MKVLIVSKILVVSAYRRKLDEIAARPEVGRLVAVTPPAWREPGVRTLPLEPTDRPQHYELRIEPIRFNGSYHLFYWPGLGRILRDVRPDIVHLDEEPYNLATAHGTWLAARHGARSLFFTWQNLLRRYPPPFRWMERGVFDTSAYAIAGTMAQGRRGPDLTHMASRLTLGAGIVANDDDTRTKWIANAQKIKPGVNMPPHALPSKAARALFMARSISSRVEFGIRAITSPVAGLRTSSISPPPASTSRPSTKLPWISTSIAACFAGMFKALSAR